jgi:hypothetical protein
MTTNARTLRKLMLPVICGLIPAATMVLAGCNSWPHVRQNGPATPTARIPSAVPTSADLVAYLNDNADRMSSLECQSLFLDASHRMQTVGLTGQMVCQKPRNFRMVARVGGNPMVDLGSNNQEFWYWISKNDPPYLFHCAHSEFGQARARMPFPFQPDWIVEALGMLKYDPSHTYQVVTKPQSLELVEQATSPQGQQVRKVTVFSRGQNNVQVTAHVLQDAAGKEICSAYVTEVQQDRNTGAIFPKRVELVWPAEHIKLKMKLDDVTVNAQIDDSRVGMLFTRPSLKSIKSFNLASGREDGDVRRMSGALP